MRLLKTTNHLKTLCAIFLFPLTASTASATSGFLPSIGICTQWNPSPASQLSSHLSLVADYVSQKIKETKHQAAGQVLITWDSLKKLATSAATQRGVVAVHFWETQLFPQGVGAAWLRWMHFHLHTCVSRSRLKAGWAAQLIVAASQPSAASKTSLHPSRSHHVPLWKLLWHTTRSPYASRGNSN